MGTFNLNTEKDFMSLLSGDTIVASCMGSIGLGKWSVESEPTRPGDIPQMLVKSIEEEGASFFMHFINGKLTDQNQKPICDLEEDLVLVER